MKQERYNNQSKIFCEISASKFEGQYVAQEDLCIQLKWNPPWEFFNELCKILKQLLLKLIFGDCFWKENRGKEGWAVTLIVSGFQLFQQSYL